MSQPVYWLWVVTLVLIIGFVGILAIKMGIPAKPNAESGMIPNGIPG